MLLQHIVAVGARDPRNGVLEQGFNTFVNGAALKKEYSNPCKLNPFWGHMSVGAL